jgi:hypothetical protein
VFGRCASAGKIVGSAGTEALAVCLWVIAGALATATPVAAGEDDRPSWREVWKWREAWSGVDASRDNWLVYSGMTLAPFSHIHEPGLRFKFAGGYGHYSYSGDRSTTPIPDVTNFDAQTYFGEALVGYLERWGPLTAKAYGGVAMIGHAISPFDPENVVFGDEFGFKGVLELWLDIGSSGYAALDLSWNTAHDTRAARSRLGLRATPSLSAGLEAWLDLNAQSDCDLGWDNSAACGDGLATGDENTELLDYTRAGVFMRYEWDGGEVSLSGGVSGGSFMNSGDASPEPYGTVNWITQF